MVNVNITFTKQPQNPHMCTESQHCPLQVPEIMRCLADSSSCLQRQVATICVFISIFSSVYLCICVLAGNEMCSCVASHEGGIKLMHLNVLEQGGAHSEQLQHLSIKGNHSPPDEKDWKAG